MQSAKRDTQITWKIRGLGSFHTVDMITKAMSEILNYYQYIELNLRKYFHSTD